MKKHAEDGFLQAFYSHFPDMVESENFITNKELLFLTFDDAYWFGIRYELANIYEPLTVVNEIMDFIPEGSYINWRRQCMLGKLNKCDEDKIIMERSTKMKESIVKVMCLLLSHCL